MDKYKKYLNQVDLNDGNKVIGEVIIKNNTFLALYNMDNKVTIIPINHIKQVISVKEIKMRLRH